MFAAQQPTHGVCVLLHGQTEFIEKYEEVIGELNARGFTVATFDWRGQGASARALSDPLKSWVKEFAQFDDDLRSFLEQIVKPIGDAPPLALAHSMGAHILLRTLHDRPQAFRAAVANRADARGLDARLSRLARAHRDRALFRPRTGRRIRLGHGGARSVPDRPSIRNS